MADEEPEGFISEMAREKMLPLRVVGGRVFVENATPDHVDRSTIELKCWWAQSIMDMFETIICIGDDKHKPLKWDEDGVQVKDKKADDVVGWSLHDCVIMLKVLRAEDGWLADNTARPKDDPILGRFSYSAPLQTADGVVNDTRPSIFAWVALGSENFSLLRNRLTANETPEFDLGIKVKFPRGTVENGWVDSKVTWNGKEALPITGATIVWKRGDWDSDADRQRTVYRKPEPDDYEPPREHVELLQSVNRLEAAIAKLAMPMWIAAGAAIAAAIWRLGVRRWPPTPRQ